MADTFTQIYLQTVFAVRNRDALIKPSWEDELYINKQKKHHKKQTFREEYLEILRKSDVDYDERYLFDFLDE